MSPARRPLRRRHPTRLGTEVLEPRQLLATIVVTSAGDADGANGGTTLSLRQAIEISNGTLAIASLSPGQSMRVTGALTSPNTIDFAIPGSGPFVIQPASALPAITSPVVIDGYSQPGSQPNSNGPSEGDNAVIQVELDGSKAGNAFGGLDLEGGGSTVRGLAIGGFSGQTSIGTTSSGILVGLAGRDLIEGDFLGLDASGSSALPNGVGITIGNILSLNTAFSTIGGTTPDARNVISGNLADGLMIGGSSTLVQGNLIGTDPAGDRGLHNGDNGIYETGPSNTIGGTTPGARNVLSGNGMDFVSGVSVAMGMGLAGFGSDDLIQGNFVGLDVTGTKTLGNFLDGIDIFEGASNTIGGTAAGEGNVISGNNQLGLYDAGTGDLIQGNLIGLDATGSSVVPNDRGVEIQGMSQTVGGAVAGSGNLIVGNNGVGLTDSFGSGNLIEGNVISGNAGVGLAENGTGTLVVGNLIGLDASGTRPFGNLGDGVLVEGTSDTIGGTAGVAGNVIADNQGDGVAVALAFLFNPDAVFFYQPAYTLIAQSGQFDRITTNQISGNQGLGIRLLDAATSYLGASGLTAGLAQALGPDAPAGANGLIASPTIVTVNAAEGTAASGTISGAPSTAFTVELFASDPSGQGKTYLGSTIATTDANGLGTFSITSGYPLGDQDLTATSTDPLGDTSEFALPVSVRSTTTTLSGLGPVAIVGQPLTLNASVAAALAVFGAPTGQVAFTVDGVQVGLASLGPSGLATLTIPSPALGPHAIQATYLGDPYHNQSGSAVATLTIARQPTLTLLYVNEFSIVGLPMTLYAYVEPAQQTNGERVDFLEDGQVIGSAPLLAEGVASVASFTIPAPAGIHAFGAAYEGSATLAPSASAPMFAAGIKLPSTTEISYFPVPPIPVAGEPITLTAGVVPAEPGQPIEFFEDGELIGSAILGQYDYATLTILAPTGTHDFTASYAGTAITEPSTSAPLVLTSLPGPTTTTLTGPSLLITLDQSVTITAKVAGNSGHVPTGTVAFYLDGRLDGYAPIDASGMSSFFTNGLEPGPHGFQAEYLGDTTHAPSLSNVQAVGVLTTIVSTGPTFLANAAGPTVNGLASPTLTTVLLAFSGPLRISSAQDLANYAIVGPNGQAVAIESADYDIPTATVTLTTRHALKPNTTYQVTVNGKRVGRVDDVYGVPLAGKPGDRPGTSFLGKVKTGPAPAKHHPTGPKKSPSVPKARH